MQIIDTDRQLQPQDIPSEVIHQSDEVTSHQLQISSTTERQDDSDVNRMIKHINKNQRLRKRRNNMCKVGFLIVFMSLTIVILILLLVQSKQQTPIISSSQLIKNTPVQDKNQKVVPQPQKQQKPQQKLQLETPNKAQKPVISNPQQQKNTSQNPVIQKPIQKEGSLLQEVKQKSSQEKQIQLLPQIPSEPSQKDIQADGPLIEISSDILDNENFTLWDLTPEQKKAVFDLYSALPIKDKIPPSNSYTEMIGGKDNEFSKYAPDFDSNVVRIDWHSYNMSQQDKNIMDRESAKQLKIRADNIYGVYNAYSQKYIGRSGEMEPGKGITYQDFFNHLRLQLLTGQNFRNIPHLKKIYQKQKADHQEKYNLREIKQQIPVCLVAPTYKNTQNWRYAWHIESVLQQDYSNWLLVILDDASPDNTYQHIQNYLHWRGVDKDKVILLRNKAHKTATENIYYMAHKYCNYNQIFYVFDGDDQILGTQTFRLFNSYYQRQKLYLMYSNYIAYDYRGVVQLGISQAYSAQVYKAESYRKTSHNYSHLKSMMSDIFLLMNSSALRGADGNIYRYIADNAVWYPSMEMSCRRMIYLPDINYWYNANTGLNDWRTSYSQASKDANYHIIRVQPGCVCASDSFRKMYEAVKKSRKGS